ncbi:MAG TPA: PAS domain S-box protein [Tepidisphaeraceae bacterium]|jgi:PAS domain S-box-containing protein
MIDDHQLDAVIFDTAANLIVVLDREGRVVKFNRACERLTGRPRQEVTGRFLWDFALPPEEAEKFRAVFVQLSAADVPAEYQNQWLTPNGRRTIAWNSAVLPDEQGGVQFIVATGRDVTERLNAEQRLRDSERRFRTIVETAQEGIWTIDANQLTTYANRRMEQMLGYDPGEMAGRTLFDFMDADQVPRMKANIERRRQGIRETFEFRYRRKDGAHVWLLVSTCPMFDEQGAFAGGLAMFADISALKEAQAAAREAERRLEFALSAANMLAWEWEPATGRRFSRGRTELIGTPQSPEEFFQRLHPEDAPRIRELVAQLLARPGPFDTEYRVPAPDGQVRWVRDRGIVETNPDGTPLRMSGISFDVTDRHQAEETLRESEERFRLVVQNSPDLMFYQDLDLRFTWFSRTIAPFTTEGVLGLTDADFVPSDQAAGHIEAKRRVIRTGIGERIDTAITISGRMYCFDTAIEPRRDAEGRIVGLACYTRDVTEQRTAQLELQRLNATLEQRVAERTTELERQTRLLELVLQNMGDGVVVIDPASRFVLSNAAAERILGAAKLADVPPAEWPTYFGFFEADGQTPRPAESLPLRRALRGESVDDAELFIRSPRKPDGTWASVTSRPIRDARGTLLGGVSVLRDLTERKAAEQALRLSETRLRLLIEQAPVSIQTFFPDGRVRSVNRAWEQLFGVKVTDIPGYNVLEDAQLEQTGILPFVRRAFAGETLVIPPGPYVPDRGRFAGRTLWLLAHMYPVTDHRGQIREIVLVHEDISEQKRVEDELRSSERHYRDLSEHNRRLLREIEHRVRNNLAALVGLISVMRDQVPDVPSFADAMEARIGGIAHVHQMLATGGWQPMELRTLIESMLGAMRHIACQEIRQRIEGPSVVVSPRRVMPLAMILVEWFTNSCKYGAHSSPAGRLTIGWDFVRGGRVRLTWEERGGPSAQSPNPASVGTELVHAFASRELNGHCTNHFEAAGVGHILEFEPNGEDEVAGRATDG